MVAQHQLFWMWIEVHLMHEIGNGQDTHIVFNECERHRQRREILVVILNRFLQFCSFNCAQLLGEMASQMLQNIHMFSNRGFGFERVHEE